jgi:hypothetical protein
VASRIGEVHRIVFDVRVEVKGLRVTEIGVGHGDGNGGPVGRVEASKLRGVVARTEIVQLRLRIASAHGRGGKTTAYKLKPRHARLAGHAAFTLASYILEAWGERDEAG